MGLFPSPFTAGLLDLYQPLPSVHIGVPFLERSQSFPFRGYNETQGLCVCIHPHLCWFSNEYHWEASPLSHYLAKSNGDFKLFEFHTQFLDKDRVVQASGAPRVQENYKAPLI